MDNKDWPKVRRAALKQGWTPEKTDRGEMLMSPDGTWQYATHRLHGSSDPHAVDRAVREMKKHGLVWPR